jgi:hypothetical protein
MDSGTKKGMLLTVCFAPDIFIYLAALITRNSKLNCIFNMSAVYFIFFFDECSFNKGILTQTSPWSSIKIFSLKYF